MKSPWTLLLLPLLPACAIAAGMVMAWVLAYIGIPLLCIGMAYGFCHWLVNGMDKCEPSVVDPVPYREQRQPIPDWVWRELER